MGSWYKFNFDLKCSRNLNAALTTLGELIQKIGRETKAEPGLPRAIKDVLRRPLSQSDNAVLENSVVKANLPYSSLLQAAAASHVPTIAKAPWTAPNISKDKPHVLQSQKSLLEIQLEEEKALVEKRRKEQELF
uniref:Uncharacterized protein n=1 Tax=Panagrolaimus sp. ES5 TaxID=591445 RepID=A0AC34FVY9_9BILA